MINWESWRPAAKLTLGCLCQWAGWFGVYKSGIGPSAAFAFACSLGLFYFRPQEDSLWSSKVFKAGVFPISYCVLWLTFGLPSWIWGLMAAMGMLFFPRLDKESAPLWRSPNEITQGLGVLWLDERKEVNSILDAGCGIGDAILSLRQVFPKAKIIGFEAGWLPWVIARIRCGAGVMNKDMWKESWRDYDLVYLFLRPEAMNKAKEKAIQEMEKDALIASLEFEFIDINPERVIEIQPKRFLRLYKVQSLMNKDQDV